MSVNDGADNTQNRPTPQDSDDLRLTLKQTFPMPKEGTSSEVQAVRGVDKRCHEECRRQKLARSRATHLIIKSDGTTQSIILKYHTAEL